MPLPLFPYQEEAAAIMASRDRYGLHDEMGIGKTATSIRAADLTCGVRGIVIAPAMLRENWINEFRKFSVLERRYCKGQNIHDMIAWLRGRYDVLVTSYEQATKWAPDILAAGEVLDFVILDEAHYLKNMDAARSKAILGPDADGIGGLIEYAVNAWHVTGTPMPNDPIDILTFLRFVQAMPLSKTEFVRRYFHSRRKSFGSSQSPKDEMVLELRALIMNNCIRRTMDDVGLQLPPVWLTETVVDGDTQQVMEILREHPGLEDAILSALEHGGLSFLDAQHIGTLRRLIGEAKAVPYAHMLMDEIRSGAGKRVVFGIHRDALASVRDLLAKHGVGVVLVNGDTPERDRVAAVKAFQEDDSTHVFIGNIRAAGTGLTLVASCELDVLESDWSPAGNAQAIKRVHRIGQTQNVRGRFITLARSFDTVVNRIVAEKTAAIAGIDGFSMHAAPVDFAGAY